jgi:tetratricopeptide (TPR) repeat protein
MDNKFSDASLDTPDHAGRGHVRGTDMNRKSTLSTFCFFVIVCFAATVHVTAANTPGPPPADKLPVYTAAEAGQHVDEIATVVGRVDCIERAAAGYFILFGGCMSEATFYICLMENASGPKLDVDKHKGTTIAASGKIKKDKSILVSSTSQIALQREPTPDELDATISRTEKALQANPRDAQAYYQHGIAQEKKATLTQSADKFRLAIDDFTHCAKLDPSNVDALVHIGDCYAALQDYAAAKHAWDNAIEASTEAKQLLKDSIAKEEARYCYAAIHDLDKLTHMEPKNAALYYRKANLYLMDHASAEANKNFQLASQLEPTNAMYAMKASHPITPSKRQPTLDELKEWVLGGTITIAGAILIGAALDDANQAKLASQLGEKQRERVRQLIAASGGTKIECPQCHGTGVKVHSDVNTSINPYPLNSSQFEHFETMHRDRTVYANCDRCDGTGVVNK